jgi:hypothetical protein
MIIHCCHCRSCQRETGSAFALNALYESERVELSSTATISPATSSSVTDMLEVTALPTESGKPQRLHRCATCKVVLFSLYGDLGDYMRFVRVGTLDHAGAAGAGGVGGGVAGGFEPDVHIYTDSMVPWMVLPEGVRRFREYYERELVWAEESLARRRGVLERIERERGAVVV